METEVVESDIDKLTRELEEKKSNLDWKKNKDKRESDKLADRNHFVREMFFMLTEPQQEMTDSQFEEYLRFFDDFETRPKILQDMGAFNIKTYIEYLGLKVYHEQNN